MDFTNVVEHALISCEIPQGRPLKNDIKVYIFL